MIKIQSEKYFQQMTFETRQFRQLLEEVCLLVFLEATNSSPKIRENNFDLKQNYTIFRLQHVISTMAGQKSI